MTRSNLEPVKLKLSLLTLKLAIQSLSKNVCKTQGCIQDFCQGGANLEYVKKRGGEAVRSCRAAEGGRVQEGDVPPPAQNVYLSEIHLHEL